MAKLSRLSRLSRLSTLPRLAPLFAILFLVTACQAVIHEKGTILDPQVVSQITVGKTTRSQVKEMLGRPTFVNSLSRNRWTYIQDRQFKNIQRTFSRVINRVEITFDRRGVVEKVQHNFAKDLLDPRSLPEAKNDQSWLGWLWDGEYMRPASKSQPMEEPAKVLEPATSVTTP